MALHEYFREYTKEDIKMITREVCIAHNCPYLRHISAAVSPKSSEAYVPIKCCMYIDIVGHSRGCMPDECTHYNDQIKSKKRRYKDEY